MFVSVFHFPKELLALFLGKFSRLFSMVNLAWVSVCMKWSRSVTSDSLRPHGLYPIRLLHPWDFPGKSAGVDCHFLLQGIFPTQESNLGLPRCRQTLYHLSHEGSWSVCICAANIISHYWCIFFFNLELTLGYFSRNSFISSLLTCWP